MTRKISFITAIGAVLALVPAAWGAPTPDVVDRAVAQHERGDFWNYDVAGSRTSDTSPGMAPADVATLYSSSPGKVAPTSMLDARERSFQAKREVQIGSLPYPDVFERAVAARERSDHFLAADDRFRIDHTDVPAPVTVGDSGREIEWPQVGIGFAVGVALLLGALLALRIRRQPLAH
jgi:hypothetical protein